MDETDRRSVGSREAVRELGSRDNLDFIGEARNHVAKGGDIGRVVAAAQQQIDGVIQRPGAGFVGPPQNSFIKVLQWNSQRYQVPATLVLPASSNESVKFVGECFCFVIAKMPLVLANMPLVDGLG
jgi:hypothetical protein